MCLLGDVQTALLDTGVGEVAVLLLPWCVMNTWEAM
jgi:hypothetical protein